MLPVLFLLHLFHIKLKHGLVLSSACATKIFAITAADHSTSVSAPFYQPHTFSFWGGSLRLENISFQTRGQTKVTKRNKF